MMTRQVALVTGSGKRRVGWHVADALARRGYALAVHYRSSAAEAAETIEAFRGRGVEAAAFQADLTDERSVRNEFLEAEIDPNEVNKVAKEAEHSLAKATPARMEPGWILGE